VWSETDKKPVVQPVPAGAAPLYAVVVGQYPDVGEARKALRAQGNTMCLSDLKPLVLSATRFPDLKATGFFLGNLLVTQTGAERYRTELGRCIGANDLKIIPLTSEKTPEKAVETPEKCRRRPCSRAYVWRLLDRQG
jgi:hypothetical protein